jgi:hypothetical protein
MNRFKDSRLVSSLAALGRGESLRRSVIIIVTLGVLVRLVLMPIAFHPDLFWVTYHAQKLALQGEITKDLAVQPIPLLLYSATIWVSRAALSPTELIWPDQWSLLGEGDYQGAFDLAMQIATTPRIHLTLFILKLPHLLFDLASAFLLLALLRNRPKQAIIALAFWMFNPIGLYISYLYGRYEAVAGFFALLSLYLFQRVRPFSSLAALALAVLSRVMDAALVPFFVLGAFRQLSKQKRLLLGALVFLAASALTIVTGSLPAIIALLDRAHGQFLLAAKLPIILYDELVIFVIGYAILLFSSAERDLSSYVALRKYSLMVFLVLFSFAFFNPQYFFALLPLLALEIAEQPGLAWYHLVQIVGYAFYLLNWGSQTTWWLFLPLNPTFFSHLTPPELMIQNYTNYKAVVAIFRSILTAASLWMVYRIYRTLPEATSEQG